MLFSVRLLYPGTVFHTQHLRKTLRAQEADIFYNSECSIQLSNWRAFRSSGLECDTNMTGARQLWCSPWITERQIQTNYTRGILYGVLELRGVEAPLVFVCAFVCASLVQLLCFCQTRQQKPWPWLDTSLGFPVCCGTVILQKVHAKIIITWPFRFKNICCWLRRRSSSALVCLMRHYFSTLLIRACSYCMQTAQVPTKHLTSANRFYGFSKMK